MAHQHRQRARDASKCVGAGGVRSAEEAEAADRALVGLGALVAAEHCLRLLELSLPQLSRRSSELRQEAYASAQARLEELRRQLEASC